MKAFFFIEDLGDSWWHVVFHPPSWEYEDHISKHELGNITLNCNRSNNVVATNVFKEMNDEYGSIYIQTNCDDIWIVNENE